MLKTLTALAMVLAAPTFAQDRDGNNTAGSWKPTYFKTYVQWDLICDERTTGDLVEERCYLRYVDVYSPRPEFGALWAFVNMTANGPTFDFGPEPNTQFTDDGFKLTKGGETIWSQSNQKCLFLRECKETVEQAAPIIDAMHAADSFDFAFNGRHGKDWELSWDMSEFAIAMDDLQDQAKTRNITN